MEPIIENYLELIQFKNNNIIEEGIVDIIKKVDPRKWKSLFPSMLTALKSKDISKLNKIVKMFSLKITSLDSIKKLAKTNISNFDKSFNLCYRVLSNTFPKVNSKLIEACSIAISVKSSSSENPMEETKKNLKIFALKTDKAISEADQDKLKIPDSTLLDEIVGWILIGILLSLIGFFIVLSPATTILILVSLFIITFIYNLMKKVAGLHGRHNRD